MSQLRSVTASVLSHNPGEALVNTVNAIAGQTESPRQIVVVDNASGDGTRAYLEQEVRVTPLLQDENVGVGAGHRVGIERALEDPECDMVWVLEHDTTPDPDCLRELLVVYAELLGEGRKVGALHPRLERNDYEAARSATMSERVVPTETLTFNGLLIDRSTFEVIGYPRADFFVGHEDFEYQDRFLAAGLEIVTVPSALAIHSNKGNRRFGIIPSPFRSYYSIRNSIYLGLHVRHRRATILAALFRAVGGSVRTLIREDQKGRRVAARLVGAFDGLAGRLGRKSYWFLD